MCRSRNTVDHTWVTKHKFKGQRLFNYLQTAVWQSQHTLWRSVPPIAHQTSLHYTISVAVETNQKLAGYSSAIVSKSQYTKHKTIHFTHSRLKQGVA